MLYGAHNEIEIGIFGHRPNESRIHCEREKEKDRIITLVECPTSECAAVPHTRHSAIGMRRHSIIIIYKVNSILLCCVRELLSEYVAVLLLYKG